MISEPVIHELDANSQVADQYGSLRKMNSYDDKKEIFKEKGAQLEMLNQKYKQLEEDYEKTRKKLSDVEKLKEEITKAIGLGKFHQSIKESQENSSIAPTIEEEERKFKKNADKHREKSFKYRYSEEERTPGEGEEEDDVLDASSSNQTPAKRQKEIRHQHMKSIQNKGKDSLHADQACCFGCFRPGSKQ